MFDAIFAKLLDCKVVFRRSFFIFVLPVAYLILTGCERAAESSRAGGRPLDPNVLLITLDTTRADRLGCYGYEQASTPALDALTLYLYLTRGWRDEEVRELLKSLICFECSSSKKVYCECDKKGLATCECDLTNSANCPRPVCFGASGGLSVRLTSKINFIKSALNFQGGKRGRPPRTSRWDMDEVRFVLNKHANYGVLQREIRQHYSVG